MWLSHFRYGIQSHVFWKETFNDIRSIFIRKRSVYGVEFLDQAHHVETEFWINHRLIIGMFSVLYEFFHSPSVSATVLLGTESLVWNGAEDYFLKLMINESLSITKLSKDDGFWSSFY